MKTMIVLALAGWSASLTAPKWPDTSTCPPTDSLTLCQLKKGQCGPLDHLLAPPGGLVGAATTCAATVGVPLTPAFFVGVGTAFLRSDPESLPDQVVADPAASAALRQCVLNSTGLLDPATLTLNRTAISAQIKGALTSPAFGEAVAKGAASCPEPLAFDARPFVACVKAACMAQAASSPVVAMARAFLPNFTPAAGPAAAKTPKKAVLTPVASPFIIP